MKRCISDLRRQGRRFRRVYPWPAMPQSPPDDGLYELCTGHRPTNPSRQEGA